MVRSSASILLLKTHNSYLFILLFHTANSNLKKENLVRDDNYSHTNLNILYANITLLKKRNFKFLWWDTAFMKNII